MNREEVKKLLGESATDEQVSAVLNKFHEEQKELKDKVTNLETNVTQLTSTNSELEKYKTKHLEAEKANMTKEQLLEAREKELIEKTKKTDLLHNSIKAKSILVGAGVDEAKADELVATIVREDENATIASANLLAQQFKTLEENVAKKTKEALLTADVKPNPSNTTNSNSKPMTREAFRAMSQADQNKFIQENPEEFYNL